MFEERLKKSEWYVDNIQDRAAARQIVSTHHYAKGASTTFVYLHGLFKRSDNTLHGVAWWLPPTRVAAESVNREDWRKVLTLSRLVLTPDVPKNGATFLLSGSVSLIRKDARFVSLVTYADTERGHTGHIYKAANWNYVGLSKPSPVWVDKDGKRVAKKSTKNRTNQQMKDLGLVFLGNFAKHKFVLHLTSGAGR